VLLRICDYPEGPIKAGAKKSKGSSSLSYDPLALPSLSQQSLESSFILRYRGCWPFPANKVKSWYFEKISKTDKCSLKMDGG